MWLVFLACCVYPLSGGDARESHGTVGHEIVEHRVQCGGQTRTSEGEESAGPTGERDLLKLQKGEGLVQLGECRRLALLGVWGRLTLLEERGFLSGRGKQACCGEGKAPPGSKHRKKEIRNQHKIKFPNKFTTFQVGMGNHVFVAYTLEHTTRSGMHSTRLTGIHSTCILSKRDKIL
ncbi:hypothetical protein E2C01_081434 [Portunus trituberculatus]|uniref:Uncharacterized protein n=1 Tax=Portunus trituberculatus TaxID=210409 RepID=A0A5B7IPS3_PORTR|nr:hypothetical protein [Portunus trituberculatus]